MIWKYYFFIQDCYFFVHLLTDFLYSETQNKLSFNLKNLVWSLVKVNNNNVALVSERLLQCRLKNKRLTFFNHISMSFNHLNNSNKWESFLYFNLYFSAMHNRKYLYLNIFSVYCYPNRKLFLGTNFNALCVKFKINFFKAETRIWNLNLVHNYFN